MFAYRDFPCTVTPFYFSPDGGFIFYFITSVSSDIDTMILKYDSNWETTQDPCDSTKTLFDSSMDHFEFEIKNLASDADSINTITEVLPD